MTTNDATGTTAGIVTTTVSTPPPTPPAAPPPATGSDDDKDWKAEYEKTLAQSRKWEDRAKANKAAADELDKHRAASMSELEKAVDAAATKVRLQAQREYGGKLVSAEVRAAAAGRPIDVAALLDGLDPTRFLTEDGDPDTTAIQGWVDKIVPAVPEGPQQGWFPDLGQGARGAPALNSSQLEKDLKNALHMT